VFVTEIKASTANRAGMAIGERAGLTAYLAVGQMEEVSVVDQRVSVAVPKPGLDAALFGNNVSVGSGEAEICKF
jgi:hypothetical protein